MAYDVMDIARYVINYCIDIGKPISNLKLQKLLYYIQTAFLLDKGKPCFNGIITKWRHGPVVVDVYNEFRKFIGEKIDEKQESYITYELDDDLELQIIKKKFDSNIIDKKDQQIINTIILKYIDIDDWILVDKSLNEEPVSTTNRGENILLS